MNRNPFPHHDGDDANGPVHLSTLTSASPHRSPSPNKVQPAGVLSEKLAVDVNDQNDNNNNNGGLLPPTQQHHSHMQQQQQQQQQHQQPLSEPEKLSAGLALMSGGESKMTLSSLASRALAKNRDTEVEGVELESRQSKAGYLSPPSRYRSPDLTNQGQNDANEGRYSRNSSVRHNVIEDSDSNSDNEHAERTSRSQRLRHRLHLHHRDSSGGGGESSKSGPASAGSSSQPQQQQQEAHSHSRLANIFSKEGVRNTLSLNSAANAFTKSSRSKNMSEVDIPVVALAMGASAALALYLRRDDKRRRPGEKSTNQIGWTANYDAFISFPYDANQQPPVFFQMLKVAVTDSEVELGMSKQIIFRVELQYGDVKWVIRRTLYDFYKLHLNLVAKNYENVPKFPGQLSYAFSLAKASLGMKADDRVGYLRETNLTRRQSLQQYLIKVLEDLNWTVSYDLYEFLEISAMSLTKDMGWKGKEAYVDMKSIDTSMSICGIGGVSRWDKSWAFLRDSYIAFCPNVGSNVPTEVFLFDQDFFVRHKEQTLGLNHRHIELGNKHKTIEIKGDHSRDMLEWMEYFNKMKQSSPWVISHRFGSFAPEREDAKVRYYVDGKDYFHAVSDALMAAKSEIYICDWWLSPELYLRRPPEKNEEFRLDRLLKKKAMEGVMIYIVVYKEISLALTLDSAHTKIWLQGLHKNIQVQRHPDHLGVNATQFWAHHEKICVIDCRIAFIGGLDLCYGRYDSRTHQLSDYHPSGQGTIWPGLDYSNPRIKDFVNVKEYNNELIEKKLLPRMPWHDVHIGMAGQPARDVARHFVQRWNFVKRSKAMKKSHMKFLTPKGEFVSTRNETGWTGSQKVQILRSSSLWSQGVDLERSIQDAYLHTIENAEHFIYIENQFFVTLAVENGHPDLKNHIGIALVNRILRAHREQKKFRVIVVMPLMPAFEADIMSSEAGTLRKVMHFQYVSICRGGNSVIERLVANGVDPDLYIGFYGLRSFDRIKHGKFDAIVEAVKEEERRQKQQKGEASQGKDAGDKQEVEDADDKDEDELNRQRSLVSKLLLDPIPKDAEAERIKEISDRRKDLDALRTWDESITKNSMARSVREHGYVPAATEQSLADSNANAQIQHEVYQAEIEDGRHAERDDNQPQILDGLGTMVRTAIEKMKGSKDQGNLEPRHHKLTRGSLPPRRRSRRRGFGYGESDGEYDSDSDSDSLQTERRQQQKRGTTDQESGPARRATEGIIEPVPQPPHVASFSSEDGYGKNLGPSPSTQGDPTEGGDASPSEFPNADEPGPVAADGRVEDNEVDDFVTEQLYIHSKLMIVDDRIIICGSANINDRSQVGFRDSEIAIIIEDTDMVDSTMNGVPYKVGKVAHTMRTDLFKEHLGLLPHVEHDVVTKASVLPVDLDAPHKDPEQARLELIRQQRAKQEQGHQQQKQKSAFVAEQAWEHDVIQQESSSSSTLAPAVGRVATGPEVHVTPPQEGGSDDPPAQVRPRKQGQRVRVASSDGDTAGGYVEEYYPDEEEGAAVDQWHSPLAAHFHDAKRASIDDPGYADRIVMDPLHDDFYELWWRRVATTNTEIFRDVFRCVPDDTVETWDDYRNFMPNPKKVLTGHVALAGATSEDVQKRLQGVTGHLVEFPLKFLSKENLLGGVVEGAVVPMEIFT